MRLILSLFLALITLLLIFITLKAYVASAVEMTASVSGLILAQANIQNVSVELCKLKPTN
jgi:hypothetical protein